MKHAVSEGRSTVHLSRRRFVFGVAAGSLMAGLGFKPDRLSAAIRQARMGPQTLSGQVFDLSIGEQPVNYTGQPAMATTVNGSLPAPTLRFRQGDTVTIRVTNHLKETSSIHWHGLILPSSMDGVPDVADGFSGIAPGETFTYRFPLLQSGTYWYHSHSGFQEQTGLYGAIIVDPVESEPFVYDRDYTVLLSDWSDEDPSDIYSKLKKLSHYYNVSERTHADLMRDIDRQGLEVTWAQRKMWNGMRMSQRDLSDVTGYTYTFLMNGVTPEEGWLGLFRPGERIRLRLVNASSMTFFDLRIPGLKIKVVAADGQAVEPVSVDELRLGVAECYDVIVEPEGDRAYSVFAQAIDRSGFARGTLTPNPELEAELPELDPVGDLTMNDMGMDMGSMDMVSMDMQGMDMPDMKPASEATKPAGMQGMDMSRMDHSKMNIPGMAAASMRTMPKSEHPSDFSAPKPRHLNSEQGPQVDMRAMSPQYRLDDPGVGLRNNGRRVLTYADLKNLRSTRDEHEPDREIELHLTGNMGRYMWSINGVRYADAEPLRWKLGERLRITFINDTMMNHPMHLHGMWSDLETGDNDALPRKHTVVVQPGSRISYRVTVDAAGGWAYHCHLLYHMMGMFRKVIVS